MRRLSSTSPAKPHTKEWHTNVKMHITIIICIHFPISFWQLASHMCKYQDTMEAQRENIHDGDVLLQCDWDDEL